MDHVPTCDRDRQEDAADIAPNVKQQHAGDGESAEDEIVPQTKESPPPPDESTPDVEQSSPTSPADHDNDRGDSKREPRNEEPTEESEMSRKDATGRHKAPETPDPPIRSDGEGEQVDGPTAGLTEESKTVGDDEATEDNEGGPERDSSVQEISENVEIEEEMHEGRNSVENIGPLTRETPISTVPEVTGILGGSVKFLIPVVLVVVVAILLHPHQPESPLPKNNVDIFLGQMEKVKTQFPHQRAELWTRSRIHLLRHLQAAQPAAPVSLILTAGLRAERTLHCLAQALASTFSVARNASTLHIDGVGKASQDSDQVKLDIDGALQGAFEGDKPVAVIHRLEELPPGSTLIFYRYCDHENAAYKESVLIFTVLLEEKEISAKAHLNAVEEMVDDHLRKKFLSHSHPVSYDRMDLDKYGGLWSRISHLILPVATEESIELGACEGT